VTVASDTGVGWSASSVALGLLLLIAGISLLIGSGGGLYWLLGEFVTGLIVAAYYGWILLIEIRR
jgi:hypothetical protein